MAIERATNGIVQIDRLHLNIPGLSREEAARLGKNVEALISRYLPEQVSFSRLNTLELKIHLPQGTSKEKLADLIARKICERLL